MQPARLQPVIPPALTLAEEPEMFDVYLVPISPERYELYCEVPDEPPEENEAPKGFVKRMMHSFRQMLAAAEQERKDRLKGAEPAHAPGWARRMRDRGMRWVAEAIAEQRLLWHLRRQEQARIVFPDDVTADRAIALVRTRLRDDGDRHRLWLIVDGIGLIASALLMLVPGPNVAAYYFVFRVVGHYLSYRGARQGLERTKWHERPSGPLSELRRVIDLPRASRRERVCEIEAALKLEHLAAFFERTALPGA